MTSGSVRLKKPHRMQNARANYFARLFYLLDGLMTLLLPFILLPRRREEQKAYLAMPAPFYFSTFYLRKMARSATSIPTSKNVPINHNTPAFFEGKRLIHIWGRIVLFHGFRRIIVPVIDTEKEMTILMRIVRHMNEAPSQVVLCINCE